MSPEPEHSGAPRKLLALYDEALPTVYGYFVRRLAERPANLAFFVRALTER